METLVIITLSIALIIFLVLLFGKKTGYKTVLLVVLAVIIVEVILLCLKNAFFIYETPEEAFSAAYFGRSNAQTVIIGNETAFVVGSSGNTRKYLILESVNNGWRIGNTADENKTLDFSEYYSVVVFHKRGTEDYYVEVFFPFGGDHSIVDNYESSYLKENSFNGTETYYAWVHNWTGDYEISIDGEVNNK